MPEADEKTKCDQEHLPAEDPFGKVGVIDPKESNQPDEDKEKAGPDMTVASGFSRAFGVHVNLIWHSLVFYQS